MLGDVFSLHNLFSFAFYFFEKLGENVIKENFFIIKENYRYKNNQRINIIVPTSYTGGTFIPHNNSTFTYLHLLAVFLPCAWFHASGNKLP